MAYQHRTSCAHPPCERSFPSHRFGATRAHSEGWFLQRNGDSWCPEHVPNWVEEWRAAQQAKDADEV